MPGLFKSKKQSKEAKRRFEHLMVVGKENPSKVFDLTACELFEVPSSLFVQCRVLLTQSLLLHTNMIKSLKGGGNMPDLSNLRVLDLHSNIFSQLPSDIGILKNLQVLNVENNKLTEFPSSVGDLQKLQSLLARDNFLTSLPQTIGKMSSLRTLDVSGSNQVYYLPKTLCRVQTLEVLLLAKPHCMEYPSPMIAAEGLEAIQKFICKDVGVTYVPPSHQVLKVLDQTDGKTSKTPLAESMGNEEEKRKQHLELERQLAESEAQLAMMSSKDKEAKHKDYLNMKKEYESLDKSIQQQQEKKENERKELFDRLKQIENEASGLVGQLLDANERARKHEALLEEMERQRLQEEQYYKVTKEDVDSLRKQETLAAMKLVLDNEYLSNVAVQKYLAEQEHARILAQQSMGKDTEMLRAELKKQESTQHVLVQKIITEEYLQKEAFAVLQFQRDAVQMRLMSQIGQLQEELIRLTHVESEKKAMKMEVEQETLRLVRTELTDLMMQLLKEKDQREEILHQRLIEMEQQKENDQVDFWLIQYQRLLDSKPQILLQKEQGLDDDVINLLRRADAAHHIPNFVRHKVTSENVIHLTERQLQSIGVFEVGIRQNILTEIGNLVAQRKKVQDLDFPSPVQIPTTSFTKPSAPPGPMPLLPTDLPSAPPVELEEIENECVVCMERPSDSVFLPCGHVCSCYQCSVKLSTCPMCRAKVTQKVRMFRS